MSKFVYVIEGIDRLGKSALTEGLQQKLGFFQAIHLTKPRLLNAYEGSIANIPKHADPRLFNHQQACYRNSMKLTQSGARIIFDRLHLSEAVYAPMYRGYDGDYVFDMERRFDLDQTNFVRMILLTEDFSCSQHFESDGDSFDDSKREAEQNAFLAAFHKSSIRDKRIVCVTDPATGLFRSREDILAEVIA